MKKLRKRGQKYYARIRIKVTDRVTEISLKTGDKEIAEKRLNDLYKQMEREAAGIAIPSKVMESAQLPIMKHLNAYLGEKSSEWRSEKYYQLTGDRLKKLVRECRWKTLKDLTAFSFTQWRSQQNSKSRKTRNNYLTGLKGFTGWLYSNGFMECDPIAGIKMLDRVVQTFERKALSFEQIAALLQSVQDPMRRAVYTTAIYTGLRRAEIEAVEYGDIHLDAPVPYIHARASTTKNGKDAVIPLHEAVIDSILTISINHPSPADKVFRVPPIETFKTDLEAAGIAYKDERGNKTDFHALRTTYCTMMVSTGVAPRVAQELMRHSDMKLTMKNYTDASLLPTASAVRGLPDLTGKLPPYTAPLNSTLVGISCPKESEKEEGETLESPFNKGDEDPSSPLVSQGEKWCRGRD